MKRATLAIVLALAASALAASPEKIFHLRNGRKVQGELVEENATRYVVKSADGNVTLPKSLVASIEDAPLPAASPSAPGKPAPRPATTPASGAPVSSVSRPAGPTSSVEEARRFLAAVPPLEPRDEEDARRKTIDSVRASVSLGALVAICAEPGLDRSHMTPPERRLALEVVAAAPAAEVRPLLARALVAHRFGPALGKDDPEEEVPADLARLVARVGPDETGAVERAALAKAGALLAKGAPIDSLAPVLDAVPTEASLLAVHGWLVAEHTPPAALPGLARTARALAERAPDRDRALRSLAALLDPEALPDWPRLDVAFQVLGDSKGEHASKLARLVDRAESARVVPGAEKAWRDCLATGRDALARIGTPVARDQLLASLSRARTEEERIVVLLSIGHLQAGGDDLVSFLYRIVEFMAERERTEQEVKLAGRALAAITHQALGNDARAWARYLDSLRQ